MFKSILSRLIEFISIITILYFLSFYPSMFFKMEQTAWEKLYSPSIYVSDLLTNSYAEFGGVAYLLVTPIVLATLVFILSQILYFLLNRKFSGNLTLFCFGTIWVIVIAVAVWIIFFVTGPL